MSTDFAEIASTVERVLERKEEACRVQQRELDTARQQLRRKRAAIKRRRRGLERFAAEWRQAGTQGEEEGKAEDPGPDSNAPVEELEAIDGNETNR